MAFVILDSWNSTCRGKTIAVLNYHPIQYSQRYHGLDFLRGIMMLLGLVIHSAIYYMAIDGNYRDQSVSKVMDYTVILISAFRMPAFFILSGFFVALLYYRRGLSSMLSHRYQRIALPFIIFMPFCLLSMDALYIIGEHIETHGSPGWDLDLIENKEWLWNSTMHLWYLYYLIIYIVLTATLIKLFKLVNSDRLYSLLSRVKDYFDMAIRQFHGIIIYGCLIGMVGINDPDGRVIGVSGFIPEFETFFFHIAFYLLGWLVYFSSNLLNTFYRLCWWYLVIALVTLLLAITAWLNQGEPGGEHYQLLHTFLAISNGVIASLLSFAFIGLSLRFCNRYNPWFRYITDASYWVYILHMTVCFAFVLLFYRWKAAAELKFLVVFSLSTFVCFFTYHRFIRSGAIGKLLNGRRYSRKLPQISR